MLIGLSQCNNNIFGLSKVVHCRWFWQFFFVGFFFPFSSWNTSARFRPYALPLPFLSTLKLAWCLAIFLYFFFHWTPYPPLSSAPPYNGITTSFPHQAYPWLWRDITTSCLTHFLPTLATFPFFSKFKTTKGQTPKFTMDCNFSTSSYFSHPMSIFHSTWGAKYWFLTICT